MNVRTLSSAVLLLVSSATLAAAQMAVHAVTGIVKAVNPHSVSIALRDGDLTTFSVDPSAHVSLESAPALRSTAAAPAQFQKLGDFVLVYYYGIDTDRTAVGIKDLGPGPFAKLQGTVVDFDKHARTLSLKDDSGKLTTLALNDSLIIDTDDGVNTGRKFTPHKGERIRVTYSTGQPATVAFLGEAL